MSNCLERGNNFRLGRDGKVSDKDLCMFVVELVMPLFAFGFKGRCSLKDIVRVIVHACSQRTSINLASKSLKKAPKASAIRYHLREKLDLEKIANEANKILLRIAKPVLSGICEFAIDLTDIPYHGKHQKDESEIVRSKAKDGTTHFHSYATLYVIVLGKRFTLALKYVRADTSKLEILEYFLHAIKSLQLGIKRIYLDKGFYSVAMINYLKRRGINAVMALPIKGKKGGIKARLKDRKSRIEPYFARSGKEIAFFNLAIVCKYSKNKYNKKQAIYFAYAVIGEKISPRNCFKNYRKRFGIETSYRLMNTCRARTSSRSPEIRLLYIAIALIIQNAWVYFNYSYMRERRSGQRKAKNGITLQEFLDHIVQGCKAIMGKIVYIRTNNYPRTDLISHRQLFASEGGEMFYNY